MASLDENMYEEHTRSHYQDERVARRYAQRQSPLRSPVEWLVGAFERRHVRRSLFRLGAPAPADVLDVPAGSGKLRRLLTRSSGFYCATDISPAMLAFARAPAAVVGDGTALPFRTDAFDITVCLRLLHRVPLPVLEAILGETARVSRTGVVLSYAGKTRSARFHRFIQLVTRRSGQRVLALAADEIRELVHRGGGEVLRDRSISFGLTAERVAAVAYPYSSR